jgi:hypothetical protein
MSQEPPDLNRPEPAWEEPATPLLFQPFSDGQQRASDPYLPEVPPPRPAPGRPLPPASVESPMQRARQERLRRLREQRMQAERQPELSRYQRQGVPPPPPPQLSFKALLKHIWEHGPFAVPAPRTPATPKLPPKIPVGIGEARPLETRVRAWIARGQRELPHLLARAQRTVQQARTQMSAQAEKGRMRVQGQQRAPGLVVLGFDAHISREEAVQRITALGGKPLRYKAATNQFQVAVPLGQEEAFAARCRQVPGVIYAGLEGSPGR